MKYIKPNIIFLDSDVVVSSQYLTNKYLEKNIKNCSQCLLCSIYYFKGIHSEKIFKYMFSKDNKADYIDKYLPTYPFEKAPSFNKYSSQEAKWCRKCKEHFDYILNYLEALFNEYSFRKNREHKMYDILDFIKVTSNSIHIPKANISKIILPYKSLPIKFRKKNIIDGYRRYYSSLLTDPFTEYNGSKRDVPEFLLRGFVNGENLV